MINVYPNPSDGNIRIDFSNEVIDNYILVVKDIMGRIVFEKKYERSSKIKLNLKNLDVGNYILSLMNNDMSIKTKITIK